MKSKILTIIFVASLALNFAGVVTVGFHWFMRHEGGRGTVAFMHHMKKILHLSDEQANTIAKDRLAMEVTLEPSRKVLQEKRTELLTLMSSENTYTPKVDTLVNDISKLQLQMEKTFIQNSFELKKVLTTEQQQRFTALLQKGFSRKHPYPGFMRDKVPF